MNISSSSSLHRGPPAQVPAAPGGDGFFRVRRALRLPQGLQPGRPGGRPVRLLAARVELAGAPAAAVHRPGARGGAAAGGPLRPPPRRALRLRGRRAVQQHLPLPLGRGSSQDVHQGANRARARRLQPPFYFGLSRAQLPPTCRCCRCPFLFPDLPARRPPKPSLEQVVVRQAPVPVVGWALPELPPLSTDILLSMDDRRARARALSAASPETQPRRRLRSTRPANHPLPPPPPPPHPHPLAASCLFPTGCAATSAPTT